MCGRFTLTQSGERLAKAFQLATVPKLEPRYNIAPSQPVAAIVVDGPASERHLTHFQWGLIPSWAKDPKMGQRLINARAETVTEKPSFRNAFRRRRCLIPADGFYEWQPQEQGKQPFYFCLSDDRGDRPPFAFAGLWEHWQGADGSEIESCTILTTQASEAVQPIHQRMPVILKPEDYGPWLNVGSQSPESLQALLKPYPASDLLSYPVGLSVNSPKHDSPDCIQPVTPSP
ncbi:MAG: SOS response-associated peptidase [Synechococcales bacterium]|nr:SOS response-associated peptidase [Synechococcales bacterium]